MYYKQNLKESKGNLTKIRKIVNEIMERQTWAFCLEPELELKIRRRSSV